MLGYVQGWAQDIRSALRVLWITDRPMVIRRTIIVLLALGALVLYASA
jgi:hypothetical protein